LAIEIAIRSSFDQANCRQFAHRILTLPTIKPKFSRLNHPNLEKCGSGDVKKEPPDSKDDGGFCVSATAGGLFLLAAAIDAIVSAN